MFRISKEVDYAVQLVRALRNTSPRSARSLREIADQSNISFLFLQRIAQKLRKGGILAAKKGVSGGYYLKKTSEPLSIHSLLLMIEGDNALVPCQEESTRCHKEHVCDMKPIYQTLQQQMIETLKQSRIDL